MFGTGCVKNQGSIKKMCQIVMWTPLNRKGFLGFANEKFKYDANVYRHQQSTCGANNATQELFQHQKIIADFLSPQTPYRGLLLYHGLGAGKTRAAIMAAQQFLAVQQKCPNSRRQCDYKIVVLLPASLESNFVAEVQQTDGHNTAYSYFHYNGLNASVANRLIYMLENNRCVVIIDEVHNFISRTCNNPDSFPAKVHKTLCHTLHNKILALSGTPVINYPREIAFLINLVKGVERLYSYDVKIARGKSANKSIIATKLHKVHGVDYVDKADFAAGRITLRFTNDADVEVVSKHIASALVSEGILVDVTSLKTRDALIIPQDEDAFFRYFIDERNLEFKNKDMFMRRIIGVASYFNHQNEALFPKVVRNELVECMMNQHQYKKYRDVRLREIGKEEVAARRAVFDMLDSPGQFYKMASRMACNFAFPAKIGRPMLRGEEGLNNQEGASLKLTGHNANNDIGNTGVSTRSTRRVSSPGHQSTIKLNRANSRIDDVRPLSISQVRTSSRKSSAASLSITGAKPSKTNQLHTSSKKPSTQGSRIGSVQASNVIKSNMSAKKSNRVGSRTDDAQPSNTGNLLKYKIPNIMGSRTRLPTTNVINASSRKTGNISNGTSIVHSINNSKPTRSKNIRTMRASQTMKNAPTSIKKHALQGNHSQISYRSTIDRAIKQVVKNADEYLRKDLGLYSCKFAKAMENIRRSPGSVLMYSQFKTVEGLAMFSEVLKAHGYAELTVHIGKDTRLILDKDDYTKPKFVRFTGDNSPEESRALLDIFNSKIDTLPPQIKSTIEELIARLGIEAELNLYGKLVSVFMITQSGAEGITLTNVRQVHVLEPYWNNIRVDQVIGRAVRTCSHYLLPPQERTVEVYRYVAKIPPSFAKLDAKIMERDSGKSADEIVSDVATKKTRIMTEVLDMIKQTSFDCGVHATLHPNVKCYDFNGAPADDIAYDLDMDLDELNEQVAAKHNRVDKAGVRVEVNGKAYIYLKSTSDLYDYAMFKKGVLVYRGRLVSAVRGDIKGFYLKY